MGFGYLMIACNMSYYEFSSEDLQSSEEVIVW